MVDKKRNTRVLNSGSYDAEGIWVSSVGSAFGRITLAGGGGELSHDPVMMQQQAMATTAAPSLMNAKLLLPDP